jgi:hypothetical protein
MKLKILILGLLLTLSLSGCKSYFAKPTPIPANSTVAIDSERFLFMRDDKFGYIDRSGKIVIPAKFDRAEKFSEGLATVQIGGKYGCIDLNGNMVILPQFNHYIYEFGNGLAAIQFENVPSKVGRLGYLDRTGRIVISDRFDQADKFSEGLAVVRIDSSNKSRYGYINSKGKVVIPFRFLFASEFKNGLAKVELTEGKIDTIDRTGRLVAVSNVSPSSPLISTEPKFNNGLAWVTIGDRLGYIDKTGKLAIPARYGVTDYSKGEPQSGRLVTKCGSNYCFVAPSHFDRGLAPVMIPERCWWVGPETCYSYGYINTSGKLVFKF